MRLPPVDGSRSPASGPVPTDLGIAGRFDARQLRTTTAVNLLAILTGLVAGYGAIGFRFLIGFFQNSILHGRLGFELVSPIEQTRGPWMIGIPAVGFLVVAYLVRTFAREARGHGVPEVIEAVMTRGGRMRKRVVSIKALASSLTIAAGGSVGREGPIVQIGSAAGSTLGQWFQVRGKNLKTLVGCGAAGAVAATFNTPIAGVVFAIELIVLELNPRSFIPLVISSVFATVVSRWHLGNEPAFIVPEHVLVHPGELVFYLGLGLLAGVVGCLTIWSLYRMEHLFEVAPLPFALKPIIGGLSLGAIGYFMPEVYGVGYETVSAVLQQNAEFTTILLLIFLKIFATSLTLSAGGSGGVFAPSLFIGAMLGGAYGWIVNDWFPAMSAGYGAYALVGMAAVFAATSRATFTAIVILFEMTLDYSIILPLMFVCVIADQVAVAILKDTTIYSVKLKRKGLAFANDLGINVLSVTPIKNVMNDDVEVLHVDMTLAQAHEVTERQGHHVYPAIGGKGVLAGIVRPAELARSIKRDGPEGRVADLVQEAPIVAHPDETVMTALRRIGDEPDPHVVVVDRWDRKLLGIVTPTDMLRLSSRES